MVFWVSHSVDYCIKIKYNNFPSSHVVVEVSCISPQPCSQGPLLMSPGVRETKESWREPWEQGWYRVVVTLFTCMGTFHSTKIPVWNFRNSTGPMEHTFRLHRTDPNHCAIVIAPVSRIQKSGTGYNLQGDPKNSGRTEPKWSVPFDF